MIKLEIHFDTREELHPKGSPVVEPEPILCGDNDTGATPASVEWEALKSSFLQLIEQQGKHRAAQLLARFGVSKLIRLPPHRWESFHEIVEAELLLVGLQYPGPKAAADILVAAALVTEGYVREAAEAFERAAEKRLMQGHSTDRERRAAEALRNYLTVIAEFGLIEEQTND